MEANPSLAQRMSSCSPSNALTSPSQRARVTQGSPSGQSGPCSGPRKGNQERGDVRCTRLSTHSLCFWLLWHHPQWSLEAAQPLCFRLLYDQTSNQYSLSVAICRRKVSFSLHLGISIQLVPLNRFVGSSMALWITNSFFLSLSFSLLT